MSQVQFDEGNYGQSFGGYAEPKGLIGFVLKIGLAKTIKQANIVLFVVFLVVLGITIFVFRSSGSTRGSKSPMPPQEILDKMKQNLPVN